MIIFGTVPGSQSHDVACYRAACQSDTSASSNGSRCPSAAQRLLPEVFERGSWEKAADKQVIRRKVQNVVFYLFTTNISFCNPNLVTCLVYSPVRTTCSSLCVSLSGPPSQSAPIIPIHPLPWHYTAIYHLSPLRCPPSHYLPHRFHFLVIVFLSSAALVLLLRSLACCALFSTRWVNKTAWFHQCESVSLTRRDPDESTFSYAAIHHDRIRVHSRWCPSACV